MADRRAALAGRWYPASAEAARREIEELFPSPEGTPKAAMGGIIPHAGWAYSGRAAAAVLHAIASAQPKPELVVLFGTHMGPSTPARISLASSFETPLGPIKAARALAERLAGELDLTQDPADETEVDNTVEVQLPILKHLLPETELLVVGPPASPLAVQIGEAVGMAAREEGRPVAVLGFTDLTHYGPNYGWSPMGHGEAAVAWVKEENDRGLVDRLVAMDPEGIVREGSANRSACCPGAAAAAVAAVGKLGATGASLLDYYTSYDVRPDRSFVGYAGVIFTA